MTRDLLKGKKREIKIGKHGIVGLIDCMPRVIEAKDHNFDHAVLRAARTSYGGNPEKKTDSENRGLIRYLYRKRHGTPFEQVDVIFFMRLPIFVARQIIRHRTASVNEYSMRYKEPKDQFFIPDSKNVRLQSKDNKQVTQGLVDPMTADEFMRYTEQSSKDALKQYAEFTKKGVGREIARINLPVSTFTEWYWEIDLRNLLGFIVLRMDPHAQKEVRDYAEAMYQLIKPLAPWTFEALEDFSLNGMELTALDIEAIKAKSPILSSRATKREQQEYQAKLIKLNLVFTEQK